VPVGPHCLYISKIPALLSSRGVDGGTPLQQLPGFDSEYLKHFLLSIGPTLAANITMAGGPGQGAGEQARAHKFQNLCG
jgi:hypothetical protein